jgi:hypothetical protein
MPLKQRSVSAFLIMSPSPFPEASIVRCAFSLFAAVEVLHDPAVNLCYADWKPSNICLPDYVTIDYGGVVPNGQPISEASDSFALDAPGVGSLRWDLNCIASTLFVLSTGFEHSARNREVLQRRLAAESSVAVLLIRLCLDESTSTSNLWDQAVSIVETGGRSDLLVQATRVRAAKKIVLE